MDQKEASKESRPGSAELETSAAEGEGGEGAEADDDDSDEEIKLDEKEEAAKKTEQAYSLIWCILRIWRRLYKIRQKNKRADLIKRFFKAVDDESKIKTAVIRFMTTIKGVQMRAQVFLQNKRARIASMEMKWVKVEDHLLSTHFKRMKNKILLDATSKRGSVGMSD